MEEINIGFRSGNLEVIKVNRVDKRGNTWLCKCDCGKEVVAWGSNLIDRPYRRANKSCGCLKNNRKRGTMEHNRAYNIWYGMNARCYNPRTITYPKYGAKGITVCKEWQEDFNGFLDWSLSNGYADDLTIDRIDPSGNYSPDNCRWVDKYVQSQNRRAQYNSKTGVSGVTIAKDGSYRVSIKRKGVLLNLGTQKEIDKAIALRRAAEAYFNEHQTFKGFDKSKVS